MRDQRTLMLSETGDLDLSGKKVLIGLSGGINSAGLLCYLASEYSENLKPYELHLFAVQLIEHSPDTFRFMKDCIRYATKRFERVRWAVRWGSVLKLFDKKNTIPHPMLSPCTEILKIIPINNYAAKHNIDLDLVGYVRTERNRITRQLKKADNKAHPIAHLSDEDCFYIVKREIGWYPEIYDITQDGKRVFRHNNCLPCKNMNGAMSPEFTSGDYGAVQLYYPEHFERARALSERIGAYWGRQSEFEGYCKFCEFD